jgi:hypothetical protein
MVAFPAEARAFFLLQSIQRPGHKDDQTPTLSAVVCSDCAYRHRHLGLQFAVTAPTDTDT